MPEMADRVLIPLTRAPALEERSKGARPVRVVKSAALLQAGVTHLTKIRMPARPLHPQHALATAARRAEAPSANPNKNAVHPMLTVATVNFADPIVTPPLVSLRVIVFHATVA